MNTILPLIQKSPVVPVIVINKLSDALPLADALKRGGLSCIEITFRTPVAASALNLIAKENLELLIAAGTVLNCEMADRAMDAGAKFLVSPGLDPSLVEYCLKKNYPIIPGVMTPSEILKAMNYGLELLKFFPAQAAGGVKMLKALKGPFPNIKFLPTGGINQENFIEYLKLPSVAAVGGSWMVKEELISSGDFAKIEELCKNALSLVNKNQ